MRRVPQHDNAYKRVAKWALDMLLFAALIVAGLAFFANCAGNSSPDSPTSTGRLELGIVSGALFAQEVAFAQGSSPVRNCQEDYGFEFGCKIDRPGNQDGDFACDGETITIDWYQQGELLRFESTVPIGLVANKASTSYLDHFFDPPVTSAEDLGAPQGRKISHSLFCWDDIPEPELGSCCFECEPGTPGADECVDETTEAWCDEEGGAWEFNVPCGERQDCNDVCQEPSGSCCIECEVGSGDSDQCSDGVLLSECQDDGGVFVAGVGCSAREDCTDFCVLPLGAICTPEGWPPSDDPNQEDVPCVDDINIDQCALLFNEEYCGLFWEEGKTCEELQCRAVPTMPWWAYALLPVILAPGAWYLMRRSLRQGRWLPR